MAVEVLEGGRTYHVRVDGDDTNDGLGDSPERALRTIQRAVDILYSSVDFAGHDVTIQVGAGFYPDTNVTIRGPHRGGGRLIIQGDVEHPGRVVLDSGWDRESMATIWVVNGAAVYLRGLHIRATSCDPGLLATGLRATFRGIIFLIGPMEFGDAAYAQILAGNAQFTILDGYKIVGGARYHLFSSTGSNIATSGDPEKFVVIEGEPHFSHAFACAQTMSVINWRYPFHGKATGPRHLVSDGGVISRKSIGTDLKTAAGGFPGSEPGTNRSGFYDGHVGGERLLSGGAPVGPLQGALVRVDMNTDADQIVPITCPSTRYLVWGAVMLDASTCLSNAMGGLYTRPGKQGTAVVSASQRYDGLVQAGLNQAGGAKALATTPNAVLDRHKLHFSLTTPEGVPAQATILIHILPIYDD
ncbi:hypothetical protein HL658_33660 [Azospirillum sp. RWY-5-1]|uniref:Uncharacterized protein n=1 Tax=Azospirillum oleiclasticum TaxID=2735135 RepID=A0ABX2TL95_9PROT|nr:hypothetical protein [Azospirillum oleiclasticum]NYZ17516.1 hypothetical protein [Azospirillum oleiclasticum]NYZ24894.1 hypothetical protein [Azospirillum oleiclasticum]